MRILIVYDSRREISATYEMAKCIADTLRRENVGVTLCRARDLCPDPRDFDLIVVGTPIYY